VEAGLDAPALETGPAQNRSPRSVAGDAGDLDSKQSASPRQPRRATRTATCSRIGITGGRYRSPQASGNGFFPVNKVVGALRGLGTLPMVW